MNGVEKGMKNEVLTIALAILMLSLVFALTPVSAQVVYTWHHDDEFGYNVSYPDTWDKTIPTLFWGQEAGVRFSSDKQKPDGDPEATISVTVFSDSEQAKWWDDNLENLESQGVVIEHGEITVNDTEGYEVIYRPFPEASPNIKARGVVFDSNSNSYVIDCHTGIDLYEGYNNDTFDTVIKSFTITPSALNSTTASNATETSTPQTTPASTPAPSTSPLPESHLEIKVDATGNATFQLTEQYAAALYTNFKTNYSEESAKNVSSICSTFGVKEVKDVEDEFDDTECTYKMSFNVPSFATKTDDVWSSPEIHLQRPVNSIELIVPEDCEIEKVEDATVTKNVCEWTAAEPSIFTIPAITYAVPAPPPIIDIGALEEQFQSVAQWLIYTISKWLLYPVLIILFILIVWSLIAIGGFLYEWHARNRDFASLERCAFKARELFKTSESDKVFDSLNKLCSTKYVHDFLSKLSEFRVVFKNKKLMEVKVEKLLQDYETDMTKRLEKSRLVTRAGPMLGLMGTLIPMGPALLALAGGDIETLAKNLIIAFGSTVLGLATGLIGHTVLIVRSRWYEQDMSDMEYLSEILFGEREVEEGLELVINERAKLDKKEGRKLRQYLNKVKVVRRGKQQ